MQNNEAEVVFMTGNLILLDMVKEALSEAGIPYVVDGEGQDVLKVVNTYDKEGFIFSRRVIVLREDVQRATKITNKLKRRNPADENP